MDEDDLRRLWEDLRREIREGTRPFEELLEWVRQGEVRPPPLPPDAWDEIRRGSEPFRRALSVARYMSHHSLKERDMR